MNKNRQACLCQGCGLLVDEHDLVETARGWGHIAYIITNERCEELICGPVDLSVDLWGDDPQEFEVQF